MGDEQVPIFLGATCSVKLAVGRPMDLLDVEAVREAQQVAEQRPASEPEPQEDQIEQKRNEPERGR